MEQEIYTTTDFYTAAVLISQGFNIVDTTLLDSNIKTKVFHFENTRLLQEIRKSYIDGKLVGNIRQFKNAVEEIKDRLHSQNE